MSEQGQGRQGGQEQGGQGQGGQDGKGKQEVAQRRQYAICIVIFTNPCFNNALSTSKELFHRYPTLYINVSYS